MKGGKKAYKPKHFLIRYGGGFFPSGVFISGRNRNINMVNMLSWLIGLQLLADKLTLFHPSVLSPITPRTAMFHMI